MNDPRKWTALALVLFGSSMLSACSRTEPSLALDDSLHAPLGPGEGYSVARVHEGPGDTYEIEHLAVSDDYLFYSINWRGLVRSPKYGGDWDWVDQDSRAEVEGVTANASEVFWVRSTFGPGDAPYTKLERRAAAGGPVGLLKDGGIGTQNSYSVSGVIVEGNTLYALDVDRAVVWAFPREGGAPTQISFAALTDPAASEPLFPNWVPDGPAVYFSTCLGSPSPTCALWKADATSGSLTNLLPLQAGPAGDSVQAVDDAFLYLVKGGHIVRMAKTDLTLSDVYIPETGQAVSAPVLLDDNNVYFLSYGPATVQLLKVPKTGGQAQPIGWGKQLEAGVWEMAQDTAFVYVLVGPTTDSSGNIAGNQILMFPKTPASADGGTDGGDGGP